MARITVEDCLDKVENRFELVMVASKRARMIATRGYDPLLPTRDEKPTVVALRELAQGLITPDEIRLEEARADESALGLEMAALASEDPSASIGRASCRGRRT